MIVGVIGHISSGKSTVAKHLVKRGFKEYQFSSKLKDITAVLFNWNRSMLSGDSIESRIWREQVDPYWSNKFRRDITPRSMLQTIGTDVFRNHLDDKIWIWMMERDILDNDSNIVISDCRFPNEIEMIKDLGGIIIKVSRDGSLINSHSSEKQVDELSYDHLIENNSTLEDLYRDIDRIV